MEKHLNKRFKENKQTTRVKEKDWPPVPSATASTVKATEWMDLQLMALSFPFLKR